MTAATNGWDKPPEASNAAWKEAIYQTTRPAPYTPSKGVAKGGKSGKGFKKGRKGKEEFGKWKGSPSWGSR